MASHQCQHFSAHLLEETIKVEERSMLRKYYYISRINGNWLERLQKSVQHAQQYS